MKKVSHIISKYREGVDLKLKMDICGSSSSNHKYPYSTSNGDYFFYEILTSFSFNFFFLLTSFSLRKKG